MVRESYYRAKEIGLAAPGMLTAEAGEAKNKVLTSYFIHNSTHGGGNSTQADVFRDLLELLTIDLIKKAIANDKFKDILELRKLCMDKGESWMSASGPNQNVPNLLQDKRFYLVGTHKKVSRVFSEKDEYQEEHIETMDIISSIESMGGFVFNTETKTMPKEYLKMHETYIISPDISSKTNIPAFMKKTLKISGQY